MRTMPPLTALRAFEATGRLGAIKEAAAALGVTGAAVTHQIRHLEDCLGVALFDRASRGLTLTAAGRKFLPTVSEAFALLQQGAQALTAEAASVLRVNSLPTFASSWLTPRLGRFHQMHPDIDIEVNTEGRMGAPVDLTRLDADVAIRGGVSADMWPGMMAEKLTHEMMFPVCAPALRDRLRKPEDLAEQTRIIVSRTPEGWREWLDEAARQGHAVTHIDPAHGPKFDTIQMAMNAAIDGMGVVIGRTPLVNAYLESGQLVAPFDIKVASRIAYWLVGREETWANAPVRAFRCWLRSQLGLDAPARAI